MDMVADMFSVLWRKKQEVEKKEMSIKELRELQVNNTLVFETLGHPERERQFTLSALKRWGFDLIFGKRDGRQTYFTSEADRRRPGERYSEGGSSFEVGELIESLPKDQKVFAHVEMMEGCAHLVVDLRQGDENVEIMRLPAGSILLAFLKKARCHNVIDALRSLGTAAELRRQRGQEGRPVGLADLPGGIRKFLKESKKIEKETGFGRLSLAYFGKNKDGDHRFQLFWLLPTISLFDIGTAEKVDKQLQVFD